MAWQNTATVRERLAATTASKPPHHALTERLVAIGEDRVVGIPVGVEIVGRCRGRRGSSPRRARRFGRDGRTRADRRTLRISSPRRPGERSGGVDGPSHRRCHDVVDLLAGQELRGRFGLASPQVGEAWISRVALGQHLTAGARVADHEQFHNPREAIGAPPHQRASEPLECGQSRAPAGRGGGIDPQAHRGRHRHESVDHRRSHGHIVGQQPGSGQAMGPAGA